MKTHRYWLPQVLPLTVAFAIVLGLSAFAHGKGVAQRQAGPSSSASKRRPIDNRGTSQSPLVIQPLPPLRPDSEVKRDEANEAEQRRNERLSAWATLGLVLVTGLLAIYTYKLWNATRTLASEAKKSAEEQSARMQESISEAIRAADAMQEVAKAAELNATAAQDTVLALREGSSRQLRAYLTVLVDAATYQERDKGLRFEARPILRNTGQTPAHKVSFRASAAVLPLPPFPPAGFTFPLPKDAQGSGVLGPGQDFVLSAIVDDYVPDNEVEDIKAGRGKVLVVWGTVSYDDIFGAPRQTDFCHLVRWLANGAIWGSYSTEHNGAT